MKATKFVICRNNLELADEYILQPRQPYYFGRIILLKSPLDYAMWTNGFAGLAFAQVVNYRIVIAFESSLSGKAFVTYKFRSDLEKLVADMADFYYEHEIKPNQGRFKKYIF